MTDEIWLTKIRPEICILANRLTVTFESTIGSDELYAIISTKAVANDPNSVQNWWFEISKDGLWCNWEANPDVWMTPFESLIGVAYCYLDQNLDVAANLYLEGVNDE